MEGEGDLPHPRLASHPPRRLAGGLDGGKEEGDQDADDEDDDEELDEGEGAPISFWTGTHRIFPWCFSLCPSSLRGEIPSSRRRRRR